MAIEAIGMTPNDSHHAICVAALDAGFHVICDKPLTTDLVTAVDLARKVKSTSAEFCLPAGGSTRLASAHR
jgi:predicted dehydrogenase